MLADVYFSPLIQAEAGIDHNKAGLRIVWQKPELMWRHLYGKTKQLIGET